MKSERRGYPRPLLMRDEWSDLCGKWDFAFDDGNAGLEGGWSRGLPAGDALFSRYKDFIADILAGKMEHNNARKAIAEGYEYRGQPIIISEYGGIAFSGMGEGWGYGNKVSSEESFIRRFDAVTIAIKKLPFVQGYCYTQVSDVEQEVNGLLTPEREFKVSYERVAEINKRRVGGS